MIGAFDDFKFEMRKRFGQSLLQDRPLVAAVSKEFLQKRVHAETRLKEPTRRRRGLEYPPDARSHEAEALKYRRECAASCP